MGYIADQLPESETELREFLSVKNPFFDYLMALKTEMPHGADIVGAVGIRMKSLWKQAGGPEGGLDLFADRLVYSPGNQTRNMGDEDTPAKVGLGAPIAYDIWYLFQAGNVLKFGGKSQSDSMEKMEDFFESVDDAKPLKNPGGQSGESGPPSGYGMGPVESSGSDYVIKKCRFEIYLDGNGAAFDSAGPSGGKNDLAGYVAVPIGPLGVMWRISLATESSLSNGTGTNVYPASGDNSTVQGGELLPPFDFQTRETCGEMMMNKGYVLDDDSTCELMAEGFGDDPEKHKWLRYWIKKENTTIVPGEFVGILCRPWPLHCWWHQETAPIVYAGNWIETEFYTSGTVKEVLVIDEDFTPDEDEVGNRYKVWVKNEEITVKASDFLDYAVDDKVGLLKTYREGDGGPSLGGSMTPAGDGGGTTNFSWEQLELQDTEDELNTEWVIVPVDFYGTTGNRLSLA